MGFCPTTTCRVRDEVFRSSVYPLGGNGGQDKPGIEIKSSVMQCAKAGRGMGRYLFLNENLLQTDNRSHRKEEIIIVSCLCTVELLHYYVHDTDVFFLP